MPKPPSVTLIRFDVVVFVTTVGAPGVELRSMIGAEFPTMVIVVTSVSVRAPPVPKLPPSFVVIVNVTVPSAAVVRTGGAAARNALMSAIVPANVILAVPLFVTVTPLPETAANVPAETLTVVVTLDAPNGESGSEIDNPLKGFGEPRTIPVGNELTGASFTAETAIVATAAALISWPSLTVKLSVRLPFVIASPVC